MSNVLKRLFPPMISDVLPAFFGNNFNFYFSLSTYNKEEDIKNNCLVHIIITNAFNNSIEMNIEEIFSNNVHTTIKEQQKKYGDYYIPIQFNKGVNNTLYKIQICFENKQNRQNCSQWSQVCLIKKIPEPIVSIEDFTQVKNEDLSQCTMLYGLYSTIIGSVTFDEQTEETLTDYRIQIQNLSTKQIQIDSGNIFSKSKNFTYYLNKNLTEATYYKLIFSFNTSSLYHGVKMYYFYCISFSKEENNFSKYLIDAVAVPDIGGIKITIKDKDNINIEKANNIVIRRSIVDSGIWEDLHIDIKEKSKDFIWYDRTVQSGIKYKYAVCILYKNNRRGLTSQTSTPISCSFDSIYLMAHNKTFRIQYNAQISNFQYVVPENIQQTIGSKYPFIIRNGDPYYRKFSISGLIAARMDSIQQVNYKIQDSVEKTFNIPTLQYENISIKENDPNLYNPTNLQERLFREKIYDFLYANDVKLLRSQTEGNILVKLTNINFSPHNELGRKIYDFSAQAIQIDQYSLYNLDKYNIQTIGNYETFIIEQDYIGELEVPITEEIKKINVLPLIKTQIQKNNEDYTVIFKKDTVFHFDFLEIEFNSNKENIVDCNGIPTFGYYFYIGGAKKFIKGHKKLNTISSNIINTNDENNKLYYGKIILNNIDIKKIDELTFLKDDIISQSLTISIKYGIKNLKLKLKDRILIREKSFEGISQINGIFSSENQDFQINKIYNQIAIPYSNKESTQIETIINNFTNIKFETENNAIITLKTREYSIQMREDFLNIDNNLEILQSDHIAPFGYLTFEDINTNKNININNISNINDRIIQIIDFKFKGIKMTRGENPDILKPYEFYDGGGFIKSTGELANGNDFENPKENWIYIMQSPEINEESSVEENTLNLNIGKKQLYIYQKGKFIHFQYEGAVLSNLIENARMEMPQQNQLDLYTPPIEGIKKETNIYAFITVIYKGVERQYDNE